MAQADGLFWMAFEDFHRIFNAVEVRHHMATHLASEELHRLPLTVTYCLLPCVAQVCLQTMPTQRGGFEEEGVDDRRRGSFFEAEERRPAKGKAKGAGGKAPPPKKPAKPPAAQARRLAVDLPRAGARLRFNGVTIERVPPDPFAPFGQYREAHRRYAEACQIAEEKHEEKRARPGAGADYRQSGQPAAVPGWL